jgi:hypothetical protein
MAFGVIILAMNGANMCSKKNYMNSLLVQTSYSKP